MPTDLDGGPVGRRPLIPGWRTLAAVSAFYLGCLAVATWPAFSTFGSTLPSRVDPLAHLWTMRWNKSCLIEGRPPFFCPEIQHPVGASLGTLPPMHFQTLLYVPLSFFTDNDVLIYNLIRTTSFLLTGLGTFLLIWNVVPSRLAAALGGLSAMLAGPMLFFSHGELEQITVGWFPLFLIAWTRWVDRPSRSGLAWSVALYALVAMSAPYFGLFATFPATLYVLWRGIGAGWPGVVGWIRGRLGWFAAFAGLTAPILAVLFANQVWAVGHGLAMERPEAEFARCRAPFWGYLVPPPDYLLGQVLPFNTHLQAEAGAVPSYLGVVTLALIVWAAIGRAKFDRRGFWWGMLGLLVVLSLGAYAKLGGWEVPLPAAWLKAHFVGFRMIRVPGRFNLFAGVAAAVVASAGLAGILRKIPRRSTRLAIFGALALVTLADLSSVPYRTETLPPVPACYGAIRRVDPGATFLDVPQFNSGAFQLPALCTYWQSSHGGRTSAGYTAFPNVEQDNLLRYNSPFDAFTLARPDYLANPAAERFELLDGVDFKSYAWLYLKVHGLRYVVVHRADLFPEFGVHLDRLKALLAEAKVFEDADAAVFDVERMAPPKAPVLLYGEGWGDPAFKDSRPARMVGKVAKLHAYNPNPERPLALGLEAFANRGRRALTLKAEGVVVARWDVRVSRGATLISPPIRLGPGIRELAIESDAESKAPRADLDAFGHPRPFSFWATKIGLVPAGLADAVATGTGAEVR